MSGRESVRVRPAVRIQPDYSSHSVSSSDGRPNTARGRRKSLVTLCHLAGLRVLDSTGVLAGPTVTKLLASRGADVLRIDPPRMPELLDQYRHVLDVRVGPAR
jgi:CoA-transferase family III